ncbi:MAG: hypothetical protein SF052_21895 [Bacteroidia bacterium]|nr:hypothetical protein [Bacteroidia bacterium]
MATEIIPIRYKAAGNLLLLSYFMRLIFTVLLVGILPTSSPVLYFGVVGLILSGIWIYIWLAFRKVLHEHFRDKSIDPFIWIIIAASLLPALSSMIGRWDFAPEFYGKIVGTGIAGTYIVFAVKIFTMEGSLFNLKKQYATTLIAQNLISLFTYQLFQLYRIPIAFTVIRIVEFAVTLLGVIFLYRIFRLADKTPLPSAQKDEENLIDQIGGKIEEI